MGRKGKVCVGGGKKEEGCLYKMLVGELLPRPLFDNVKKIQVIQVIH